MSRKSKFLGNGSTHAGTFAFFRHADPAKPLPTDTVTIKPRVVKPGYRVEP